MRLLIQRVLGSSVIIDNELHSSIGPGILVFIGITHSDSDLLIPKAVNKLCKLRIFPNEQNKLDYDVMQADKEILVVSQFTLYGSTQKGLRPDFFDAANKDLAEHLYNQFILKLSIETKKPVPSGIFSTEMKINLINDGPFSLILDFLN